MKIVNAKGNTETEQGVSGVERHWRGSRCLWLGSSSSLSLLYLYSVVLKQIHIQLFSYSDQNNVYNIKGKATIQYVPYLIWELYTELHK